MAEEPDADLSQDAKIEQVWRAVLTGYTKWHRQRRSFLLIPAKQRCKNCLAPLTGLGVLLMRRLGRGRFSKNPRFCEF